MLDVLITGASGFTGLALSEHLHRENKYRLTGLSRSAAKNQSLYSRVIQADLGEISNVRNALIEAKPTWIFHLAGQFKGTPSELFQSNLQNTIHLLDAATEVVPEARILLIGSAAEYGAPVENGPIRETVLCSPAGPYGLSKHGMTLAGLDFGKRTKLQINVARSFNLLGPGVPSTLLPGALIQRIRIALETGAKAISVGNISAERDFLDVRDAVEAYLLIMKSSAKNEIFNVCSGVPIRIKDLVESIIGLAARPLKYQIDTSLGDGGITSVVGDPSKLRDLGFSSRYSLLNSIRDSFKSHMP